MTYLDTIKQNSTKSYVTSNEISILNQNTVQHNTNRGATTFKANEQTTYPNMR